MCHWCDFKLSEILKKCGLGGNFDNLVFEAIDGLIESGKLVFMYAGIKQFMNFRDIFFTAEFAAALKSNYPLNTFNVLRFYPLEPLSQAEIKKRSAVILSVTEHVQKIRAERDAHFKEEFGDRSGEAAIEKETLAEEREIRRQEHHSKLALLDIGKNAEIPERADTKT